MTSSYQQDNFDVARLPPLAMAPSHQKSASFPSAMPSATSPPESSDVFTQDILWENYKQQAILVEKYKQQLALLDNYKKQALFQRLYNAKQMEQQQQHQQMDRNPSSDFNSTLATASGEMSKLDDEQFEAFKRQQQQQQLQQQQQQQGDRAPMTRKLSTGSSSSANDSSQQQQQLADQFKQMSMQDTLQKRTLAMQESIRQTLAAAASSSGDLNNNPMTSTSPGLQPPPGVQNPPNANAPGQVFDPRALDDLNIIDMLADPRWSGAKQYRGFEEGRDPHRRDNGN